uniref:Uncharacterized protein n=1 Tax=Arundo donax TaxID=35708 RepID=A0A0A8XNK5_ARUDO
MEEGDEMNWLGFVRDTPCFRSAASNHHHRSETQPKSKTNTNTITERRTRPPLASDFCLQLDRSTTNDKIVRSIWDWG